MNYVGLRNTASRLMASMGNPATVYDNPVVSYNPENGSKAPGVQQTYEVSALEAKYLSEVQGGTRTSTGEAALYLSAITISGSVMPQPTTGMGVIVGGLSFEITRCEPVSPGPLALMYFVKIRPAKDRLVRTEVEG